MRVSRRGSRSANQGLTLVETAIVMTIAGLLVEALVTGQGLIENARVHDIVSQQSAVESAFQAFQDRYRALPGDYSAASTNINCGATPCLNGNGNFRIEAGSGGAVHEEILAWQHMSAAGFLSGSYMMANAGVTAPAPDNTLSMCPVAIWRSSTTAIGVTAVTPYCVTTSRRVTASPRHR